jgi:hypothetical protein
VEAEAVQDVVLLVELVDLVAGDQEDLLLQELQELQDTTDGMEIQEKVNFM